MDGGTVGRAPRRRLNAFILAQRSFTQLEQPYYIKPHSQSWSTRPFYHIFVDLPAPIGLAQHQKAYSRKRGVPVGLSR